MKINLDRLQKKFIQSANKFKKVNPIHSDDSAPCYRGKKVKEWHTNHEFVKTLFAFKFS